MEFNISFLEKILEREKSTGFEEFLSSMNFTFETNQTTESTSSEPETIITITLSMVALILNFFAVCGTYNIPNGLTTHSKLIISLAISDILIVISVLAHQISNIVHEPLNPLTATANERISIACSFAVISSLNIMAHLISLLNLLMMAVDHYLAIIRPYQYAFLLNKRNGIIIIISMWSMAFLGAFVNFFTGIGSFEEGKLNYCEYIMYNDFHGDYLVIAFTFVCLLSIVFMYLRIYCEVRKMNKRLTLLTFNKEHNSKTLITTLLIIGTFTVCWMPLFTLQTVLLIKIHVDPQALLTDISLIKALILANKYLYSLLLLNSICDPIIYAVRIKEVQLGYKKFWKSLCGEYKLLQNISVRKSSKIVSLLERRKTRVVSEQETGERTICLMMSENGCDKDKEKSNIECDNE